MQRTITSALRKTTLIPDNQDTQEIQAFHIYRTQDWNTHHHECQCEKCRSEQGHVLVDLIQDVDFDLATILGIEGMITLDTI